MQPDAIRPTLANMGIAYALAVVAGVVTLAVVVARGGLSGARFTVDIRSDDAEPIRIKGTVPGLPHGEVVDFLGTLDLPPGARIRGIPDGDRVSLRFSAEVPGHLHQRLRNFFYLNQ